MRTVDKAIIWPFKETLRAVDRVVARGMVRNTMSNTVKTEIKAIDGVMYWAVSDVVKGGSK